MRERRVFSSRRKSSSGMCSASGPSAAARSGSARAPFDAAEMPDVVVNQQASIEFENGAGVRAGFGIQQQLSSHPQMNHEHAPIERRHDKLAVALDGLYKLIANCAAQRRKFLAHYVVRRECASTMRRAGELGRQRPNYGLDFRKLRHAIPDRAGCRRPRLSPGTGPA